MYMECVWLIKNTLTGEQGAIILNFNHNSIIFPKSYHLIIKILCC